MTTTAEPPADQEEMQEPIPNRSDIDKAKRNVFNKHLAHEGIMLESLLRTKRRAERMERFAATGKVEDLEPTEGEDDVSVNIGNEMHYHVLREPPTDNTASPPETNAPFGGQQAEEKSRGRKLAEVALAAALAGGAAGALPWAYYQWSDPANPSDVSQDNWELGLEVTDEP